MKGTIKANCEIKKASYSVKNVSLLYELERRVTYIICKYIGISVKKQANPIHFRIYSGQWHSLFCLDHELVKWPAILFKHCDFF